MIVIREVMPVTAWRITIMMRMRIVRIIRYTLRLKSVTLISRMIVRLPLVYSFRNLLLMLRIPLQDCEIINYPTKRVMQL